MPSRLRPRLLALLSTIGLATGVASAQEPSLAEYFGFGDLEVLKVGRLAGPFAIADMDGDGLDDVLVANNFASRLEIHHQRADADPDRAVPVVGVNEFPEHWRFRRESVSVMHRVSALVPHDFDGDGLLDVIYNGVPEEIVFLRQTGPGVFEITRRHRVRELSASRDGLGVADVTGDDAPELLAIAAGRINVWPLAGDSLGAPRTLAAGAPMVAFVIDDYDGDGLLDVAGIIPEDAAPIRLWLGTGARGAARLGAQLRFDMPGLRECTSLHLPGERAARLAVIERASKRMVVHRLVEEPIEESGDRDASIRALGFTDAESRERDHAVADVDGDGLLDLVATDTKANAIVVYRQVRGEGFQAGESFPSLTELVSVVAGNVDDDPEAEIFVLSEKEGVVGRCDVAGGSVPFPRPLQISAGHVPTALNLVPLENGPHLAVIAKSSRDHVVDLLDLRGGVRTIDLGKQSRSPETIVALDADQDGRTDLLLFTREKPMMMLRATEGGFELSTSEQMGQFGLVQAAQAENTAVHDVDDDGLAELLIADKNYVRAVRYEPAPPSGVSPGWQVVRQINAADRSSNLVALAILDGRIVAADRANGRLVVMDRAGDAGAAADRWTEVERLAVRGFPFNAIHAGRFSGGAVGDVLAVGDDAFAVVRLGGRRLVLKETNSWRSPAEQRLHHELAAGDVNGDGFADLVSLDAGEQMCEIFTFTESGRMLPATAFQVFESRLFAGGSAREYEPSQVAVADLTGDGRADLVLLAHDRVLVYPQMPE